MTEINGPEGAFDFTKAVAAADDSLEKGHRVGYITDQELAQKAAEKELENRDNITDSDREEALFRSSMSDIPYTDQDISGIEANKKSSEVVEQEIYQKAFQSYIDLGKTEDEAYKFAHEQVQSYRAAAAKRSSYYAE